MNSTNQFPVSRPDRRLLRLAEVKRKVGLGRSAIYERVKRGDFPSPISLGSRAVAWDSDEIDAWIQERIAQSRSGKETV